MISLVFLLAGSCGVQVPDPPLAGQAGEPGWEHQWWRGRTEPDVIGDFDRLALRGCVMPQRAEVTDRYSQRRPAAGGISPDKIRPSPERAVPVHGRRALAEPPG